MMFNPHLIRRVVFNWIERRTPMPDIKDIPLHDVFLFQFLTINPTYRKPILEFGISEYLDMKRVYLLMLKDWINADELYRRRWETSKLLRRMVSPNEFNEACFKVSMDLVNKLLEKYSPEDAHA